MHFQFSRDDAIEISTTSISDVKCHIAFPFNWKFTCIWGSSRTGNHYNVFVQVKQVKTAWCHLLRYSFSFSRTTRVLLTKSLWEIYEAFRLIKTLFIWISSTSNKCVRQNCQFLLLRPYNLICLGFFQGFYVKSFRGR